MKNIEYIFDFMLEEIQADKCEEMINYLQIREKWKGYYSEFGLTCPTTSDNNFRDSWFHYRKIYKERRRDEIIRQIANYEEHLQRAERDLVVKFFQDISSSLEEWYLYGLKVLLDLEKYDSDIEQWKREAGYFNDEGKIEQGWFYSLYLFCKNNGKTKNDFWEMAIYFFREYIWCDELKVTIQKLLHKMKNIILNVRLGNSEIDRMEKIGLLTEQCVVLYEELLEFCDKQPLKEVIVFGATEN